MWRANATASAQIRSRQPGSRFGAGRDLDHLLVAPLQRAVALVEVHDVARGVGEDLHLDVPRVDDGLLQEHRRRRRTRTAPRAWPPSMDSRSCPGSSTRRIPRPPPPATALTNSGKPDLVGRRDQLVDVRGRRRRPEHRHARLPGGGDRAGLVAGQVQHLRRRADERDAGVRAGLRPDRGSPTGSRIRGRSRRRPPGGQRRSPRRPTGRRAPGGRARRSWYDSSAFARCSELRSSYGKTATVASPARRPRGRRGSRSRHGWRPAPCGTRDPPGTAERTVTPAAQMVGRGDEARGDRRRESLIPPCQGNRNVAHPFGPGAIVCCSVPRTYETPTGAGAWPLRSRRVPVPGPVRARPPAPAGLDGRSPPASRRSAC